MPFLGEYPSTVDAKGRFLLPSGVKKQLADAPDAERFVVSRGFEKCLTLYPLATWAPLHEQITQLNAFDPKVRQFQRQFLGGATEVELDSAGRMLIPPQLKAYAGLDKDIVLVAQGNKLEIWDAQAYNDLFSSINPTEFSTLASEVMRPQSLPG